MKQITITNQKEFDALPISFDELTEIIISGNIYKINTTPENGFYRVSGSAVIKSVSESAVIEYVSDSAVIKSVSDSAVIEYVSDSAVIKYVYGSAVIKSVYDSAVIEYVSDSAVIESVYGNSIIKIYSDLVSIKKALQECVVIIQDCNPKLPKGIKNLIRTKTATYTKKSFLDIYSDQTDKNTITLYKSINPETDCDFYTGRIKYEDGKKVKCPDWNPDSSIECGNGLHLSPTPQMALSYKQGKVKVCKVKVCKVNKKDFVVYPKNITKVRCKKVFVVGDYEGIK
jgi:hypothetical protein